jgi:hypothetical protein
MDTIVAIAALLGCAGVTLVLATLSAFSWLALSDKFAAASSEAQKKYLLNKPGLTPCPTPYATPRGGAGG